MRHAAPRFARLRGWRSGASVERSPNGRGNAEAAEKKSELGDPPATVRALPARCRQTWDTAIASRKCPVLAAIERP